MKNKFARFRGSSDLAGAARPPEIVAASRPAGHPSRISRRRFVLAYTPPVKSLGPLACFVIRVGNLFIMRGLSSATHGSHRLDGKSLLIRTEETIVTAFSVSQHSFAQSYHILFFSFRQLAL